MLTYVHVYLHAIPYSLHSIHTQLIGHFLLILYIVSVLSNSLYFQCWEAGIVIHLTDLLTSYLTRTLGSCYLFSDFLACMYPR